MKPSKEDILQAIEADSRERTERVRMTLLKAGRRDLLADYDAQMRDIALGIDGARSTWNALSEAQRRALRFANATDGKLYRSDLQRLYLGCSGQWPQKAIRLATVRNLIARELLACDGGAFDPEKVLVLTERGRFVLKFAAGLEAEAAKKGKRGK